MGKLLKFEFRKLFRTKSLYICTLLPMTLIFFVAIVTGIRNGILYVQVALSSQSMFTVFLGIYMANFVCLDQSNDTLKNVYARGYERNKVYAAKYIVSLVGAIFMMVMCFLSAFIVGSINETVHVSPDNDFVLCLLVELLGLIAFHALYFIISNSIGKTGGAIALNIAGPTFVSLVLAIVDTNLLEKGIDFRVTPYWINSTLTVTSDTLLRSFIVALVYILIFIVIGFILNKHKEAK